MKVLAGELHETVYHNPENGPGESKPLSIKSAKTYGMNGVTYISDDIGLHRVHNPSSSQLAVSLHRELKLHPPESLHQRLTAWKCTRHPMRLTMATIFLMRRLVVLVTYRRHSRLRRFRGKRIYIAGCLLSHIIGVARGLVFTVPS